MGGQLFVFFWSRLAFLAFDRFYLSGCGRVFTAAGGVLLRHMGCPVAA